MASKIYTSPYPSLDYPDTDVKSSPWSSRPCKTPRNQLPR